MNVRFLGKYPRGVHVLWDALNISYMLHKQVTKARSRHTNTSKGTRTGKSKRQESGRKEG